MSDLTTSLALYGPATVRPTPVRTEANAEAILDRLSDGIPLRQICRDLGIGWRTVYDWMDADADLAARIAHARKAGYDAIAQDALDIADETSRDTLTSKDGEERANAEWIARSKLRVETRLKLLAKWDPSRYGERVDVTSAGAAIQSAPVVFAAVFPPGRDEE